MKFSNNDTPSQSNLLVTHPQLLKAFGEANCGDEVVEINPHGLLSPSSR